ncbi:hypothetical protein RFI_10282 [Reticulomyxa filosa]|uniref:RNA helicase n=1 Tax=Reticulomyxa filosa TaxID=46433 RepID=X6NN81_RETFI|nr:hypothetical protein RFI_10282 [Reticulomyxa filosa]|eukprot:ETO26852.1 hypothetical protein RFI_10282 [Reticulomyxa filosa]
MTSQKGCSYVPPHKRDLQVETLTQTSGLFSDTQQRSSYPSKRHQASGKALPRAHTKSSIDCSEEEEEEEMEEVEEVEEVEEPKEDATRRSYEIESEMEKLSMNQNLDSSENGQQYHKHYSLYTAPTTTASSFKSRDNDTWKTQVVTPNRPRDFDDGAKMTMTSATNTTNTTNTMNTTKKENTNRFELVDRRKTGLLEEEMESQIFDNGNEMTQGINFDVYDKIPVELSGDNPPEGLMTFEESHLHEQLLYNIQRCKYVKPTPVQKYAIPCILTGKDLMACAQTGSGKTAAFLLPIIHRMMTLPPLSSSSSSSASAQKRYNSRFSSRSTQFLWKTGMRSVVVYGGANAGLQLKELSYGCDLIVATPGRLLDFIDSGKVSVESTQFCALDEGDRMLDMGFMPQIQDMIRNMPRKGVRQMLMFSATFPSEIQQLAQEFLNGDYLFLAVGRVGSTNTFIRQKMAYVEDKDKVKQLVDTLGTITAATDAAVGEELTLIFVETRRDADDVEEQLLREGLNAISIHGDRSQKEREQALALFRSGKCPILVATDVAARGLDIPNVLWVINFDLPNNIEAYVHRIGRTGRCGHDGNAIAFVNEKNKPILQDLIHLLRETKQDVPQWFSEMVYQNRKTSLDKRYSRRDYREYGNKDYRHAQTNNGSNFTSRRFTEGKDLTKDREHSNWNHVTRDSYSRNSERDDSSYKSKPIDSRGDNTTDSYSKWDFGSKNDSW